MERFVPSAPQPLRGGGRKPEETPELGQLAGKVPEVQERESMQPLNPDLCGSLVGRPASLGPTAEPPLEPKVEPFLEPATPVRNGSLVSDALAETQRGLANQAVDSTNVSGQSRVCEEMDDLDCTQESVGLTGLTKRVEELTNLFADATDPRLAPSSVPSSPGGSYYRHSGTYSSADAARPSDLQLEAALAQAMSRIDRGEAQLRSELQEALAEQTRLNNCLTKQELECLRLRGVGCSDHASEARVANNEECSEEASACKAAGNRPPGEVGAMPAEASLHAELRTLRVELVEARAHVAGQHTTAARSLEQPVGSNSGRCSKRCVIS